MAAIDTIVENGITDNGSFLSSFFFTLNYIIFPYEFSL